MTYALYLFIRDTHDKVVVNKRKCDLSIDMILPELWQFFTDLS